MKSNRYLWCLSFLFLSISLSSQTTFSYLLRDDFSGSPQQAPELTVIPNNSGFTGTFVTRVVPSSTCPEGGDADGYYFEDDAGLQFDNPEGFIDCEYTLQMIFQVDELVSPPPWVRLLSFTHVDDVGIYIYITGTPNQGTLEFWPYGTVGVEDFFTTEDFYQLTLVRECSGLIRIYINGSEFALYDDSLTQAYVPQAPNDYIVFFRDHPSVLADEASAGFVSNIILSDYPWTEQQVADSWENFCPTLLAADEAYRESPLDVYPLPVKEVLHLNWNGLSNRLYGQISGMDGRLMWEDHLNRGQNLIPVRNFPSGMYVLTVRDGKEVHSRLLLKQ